MHAPSVCACSSQLGEYTLATFVSKQIIILSLSHHHACAATYRHSVVHVTTSLAGHVRIHIYSNGILVFP